MRETLKTTAKITTKTVSKWILIVGIGIIVTVITLGIALYRNIGYAGGGHGNAIALFVGMLIGNFFAFLLVFGSPIFIGLYIVIANKISIQNAIYLTWKSKAGDYILSKVHSITKKLTEKEGWRKNLSNKMMLKTKVLQLAKDSHNISKLERKIIGFGFQKIKLDEINFQDENLNLSDVITRKFDQFISQIAKPSLKLMWILVLIQIILLIISIFFEG